MEEGKTNSKAQETTHKMKQEVIKQGATEHADKGLTQYKNI